MRTPATAGPEDPQRDRLYAAEDAVLPFIGPRFTRWRHVEQFLESVLSSPDYGSLFPEGPLDIALGQRSRSARASLAVPSNQSILIRSGSWNALTVLHELAHLVALAPVAHGPEFVATELELIRTFCGFEAFALLRTSCIEHRVNFNAPPLAPLHYSD